MLDALEAYLDAGGRLMYLGGNGFYWVTAVDPERPHVIEIRRWGGTETWGAAPGEGFSALPASWVGSGATATASRSACSASASPPRATTSPSPTCAIPTATIPAPPSSSTESSNRRAIGDFPSLMLRHGAGRLRDRPRRRRARHTPARPHPGYRHRLLRFLPARYRRVALATDGEQGGTVNPLVRADIVFFEGPNGGAVFSVGSIAWTSALSYNGADNDVSRITENVLLRFAADEPF